MNSIQANHGHCARHSYLSSRSTSTSVDSITSYVPLTTMLQTFFFQLVPKNKIFKTVLHHDS